MIEPRIIVMGYAGVVAVMSVVTFAAYVKDKRRAQWRGWRVPERTLHLLELSGGWPGAWVAQRVLRHKTQKASYRAVFALIVLLHVLAMLVFWYFVFAPGR